MNLRLIKLCLKSNTCEIINSPCDSPLPSPPKYQSKSFCCCYKSFTMTLSIILVCHLLLVLQKLESQMLSCLSCCHMYARSLSLYEEQILIYKFSTRLQENTTYSIMLFHVINFNKQFDFRTHPLRGPPDTKHHTKS